MILFDKRVRADTRAWIVVSAFLGLANAFVAVTDHDWLSLFLFLAMAWMFLDAVKHAKKEQEAALPLVEEGK